MVWSSLFAQTTPDQGVTDYLFTQGVLGVVCVGLIIVVVYLTRKLDKKDIRIDELQEARLADNKAHTLDYRDMAKDEQEVMNNTSQNLRVMTEKIEIVKGRRQ